MLLMVLALALAGDGPGLDLDLACPGLYQDSDATMVAVGGETAMVDTPLQRPMTARLRLLGSGGELVYPGGARWTLTNVTADEDHISAQYVWRRWVFSSTWRVDVNRLSGDLRVASHGNVAFVGICQTASSRPKF